MDQRGLRRNHIGKQRDGAGAVGFRWVATGWTDRVRTAAKQRAEQSGRPLEYLYGSWKLVLRLEPGKCLHYYFYFLHEQLGLLHLRLQTWFPFAIHLCLNGCHWLARQLDQADIGYVQRENCFTWIQDIPQAQALARQQLESCCLRCCQPLIEQCHPHAAELCRPLALS
jgi:hypothetical protein